MPSLREPSKLFYTTWQKAQYVQHLCRRTLYIISENECHDIKVKVVGLHNQCNNFLVSRLILHTSTAANESSTTVVVKVSRYRCCCYSCSQKSWNSNNTDIYNFWDKATHTHYINLTSIESALGRYLPWSYWISCIQWMWLNERICWLRDLNFKNNWSHLEIQCLG